ncbi:PAS domain S-box protein [Anabaena azotica]|uniref:histidine kinase n=1 Tax=Anabaena azotica FACHB-119 TaxID=947527 RepID=A0ABR8D1S2_9NOST|nr:PAS domain S-box protein [Anabaena azotica FACHB-119]
MTPKDLHLDQQIISAQERLAQIQQQANAPSSINKDLLSLAIAELSTALEELSVMAEELHQQNEELLGTHQMLELERQRYQDLFNFAPDAYMVTDDQGVILEANHAAQNLLNIRHDYMVGKPLILFVDSGDHGIIYEQLEKLQKLLIEGGKNFPPSTSQQKKTYRTVRLLFQEIEVFLKPRQKQLLPTAISLAAECDHQGLIRLYWLFRDLSDVFDELRLRKQAEEQLKASEAQYRLLFENHPQPMWIFDPQTLAFVAVNQAAIAHYGYSQSEFLAMTLVDILAPEEIPVFEEKIEQYRSQELPLNYYGECQHRRRDGSIIDVEITSTRITWAGKIAYFVTIKDVSALKQTQQKIREQAALIDVATDAIFVRDLQNHIIFWSRGAESLYGWTAEETLGTIAHEIFQRELLSQLEIGLQATLEDGSWQGELEQITKTGREITVASRWTLVQNLFGHPQSILVVNTDITEKKQLEQQFYRAQRLESVGTLASGIAHDLNNVFAPILMIAQLLPLKCKNVDARTQALFQTLETSSQRGANLIKQILTFTRGTEGQHILLQPEHLLKELVTVIKQTFPKSIEIISNIPKGKLWTVQADPTQLEQVFMNLAVNARDAMPNGGKLTITAENRMIDTTYSRKHIEAHAGGYVVVTVSDTGMGIAPEFLERIFDPFFTTKEIGKGTGLGLSTVLGIVKNHCGFVEVSTQLGKGTQFQVFLPRGEGAATQTITKAELLRGNGESILVVDDEVSVQQTIQTTLENYNYKILVANDGIEALTLYIQYEQEINAVLLDMFMPNMDGLITIRTLHSLNPNVKIIATSGLPANEQDAIVAGAETFLSKPYTAKDLLEILAQVLATSK